MGQGLSRNHRSSASLSHRPASASLAPARVIAADGSLAEFFPQAGGSSPATTSVADMLGGGNAEGRFFVCSSDTLYFGASVLALGADVLLRPGQIYFVLPTAMLGRPLSSADMAALAVRASEALAARATRPRGHGHRARGGSGFKKLRVVPVREDGDGEVNEKLNQRTLGDLATASLSPARIAKKSAMAARRTVRRALSTIEEDAEW